MTNANFYRLFEPWVQLKPSGVVFELDNGEMLTREWLHALSGRYAKALLQSGCSAGDRIAVQLEKSAHAFALYLACLRAGLCYLPINTAYRAAELGYLLEDAQPAIFFRGLSAEALAAEIVPATTKAFTFGPQGEGTFVPLVEAVDPAFSTIEVSGTVPAALLYTSGTTGRPKGALISHGALSYSARTLSELWGFSSSDVLLHTLPIFHSHGLFISFNVALASGARLLLQSKFDAADVVKALPRSTVFMGVPTFYHRLLTSPLLDSDLCRRVRLFVSGSAHLSADVHRKFEARTGHRILERYGSTEAMILCSNPLEGERRPNSVGLPIPGVDLRIAGDGDEILPTGNIGMIQARGPGLFSGYWNMPDQTRNEFAADGFFRTGDLGFMDSQGYVSITGRAKDLIISGGYNVYPAEIEAVIDEMPSVQESAVVGAPHADFGECVIAFVIPSDKGLPPAASEVVQRVKDRLANYKVPKQVIVVDELPRNTMGKVMKNELRTSLADRSGAVVKAAQ
ncbi:AMP-binding protein [Bradyrhizobium sp. 139]|uniref:AMP-binding protein n=1 Tax=Bradyrhizobium sp. 139 TaxID=2782616 RepID=UPI001FF91B04|nr:AMP-binding protein [Bradyrhizobium sp. 139]MCK1742068.1 AMP-binding protein [Bradyrhizobium sp. 139]